MQVVIDTSIAVKWFVPERDSDKADDLRHKLIDGELTVIVPDLLYYELGNLLCRQCDLAEDEIIAAITSLEDVGVEAVTPDIDLLRTTAFCARDYAITFYDASFVALALIRNCPLITADKKLVNKVDAHKIAKTMDDFTW